MLITIRNRVKELPLFHISLRLLYFLSVGGAVSSEQINGVAIYERFRIYLKNIEKSFCLVRM